MPLGDDARLPDGDPWRWSATEIRAALAARTVSAAEVTESCLERARDVDPELNALVDVDEAASREDAARAGERIASGTASGVLDGVPVSIKINTDERGRVTTDGVPEFADAVAEADSQVVAALRRAGSVLMGRSNVPAFSFRWFSENPLHGRTRNPWDAARTPGGSSGGAAAAVASGMVPLAHGNDIGGSIRYPAYACGVAGLRPTVGRVPWDFGDRPDAPPPSQASQVMCTHGPIARTVADLRLGLAAMSAFDAGDGVSVPVSGIEPGVVRRVAVVRDPGLAAPHPSVAGALDAAAGWLADAGAEVVEADLPDLAEAHHLWGLLLMPEMWAMRAIMPELTDAATTTAMEHMLDYALSIWDEVTLDAYVRGWTDRNAILRRLADVFAAYPVLLTPASAQPPFPYGTDTEGGAATRAMFDAQWPQTSLPVLGLPGVTVPTGVVDGLPTGVQLTGPRHSDETLLRAAALIEDRAGVLTPISPWGNPVSG